MIALTRRYAFPAAHVLRHPSLGDAENRRIYGKCANPAGHGHNYGIEVTVSGPQDAQTGRIQLSPQAVMNAGYIFGQQTLLGTDNGGHCSNWASWPNS